VQLSERGDRKTCSVWHWCNVKNFTTTQSVVISAVIRQNRIQSSWFICILLCICTDTATHWVADTVGWLVIGWSHRCHVSKQLDRLNHCLVQELQDIVSSTPVQVQYQVQIGHKPKCLITNNQFESKSKKVF